MRQYDGQGYTRRPFLQDLVTLGTAVVIPPVMLPLFTRCGELPLDPEKVQILPGPPDFPVLVYGNLSVADHKAVFTLEEIPKFERASPVLNYIMAVNFVGPVEQADASPNVPVNEDQKVYVLGREPGSEKITSVRPFSPGKDSLQALVEQAAPQYKTNTVEHVYGQPWDDITIERVLRRIYVSNGNISVGSTTSSKSRQFSVPADPGFTEKLS